MINLEQYIKNAEEFNVLRREGIHADESSGINVEHWCTYSLDQFRTLEKESICIYYSPRNHQAAVWRTRDFLFGEAITLERESND